MESSVYGEFTSFMENEKNFLWSQAIGLTKKAEDAEDLLQDTLLKAYKGWNNFDQGTNIRAWLGKIMLNTHINNINRRRDEKHCDFSAGEYDRAIYQSSDDNAAFYRESPEKIFFNKHIDRRLTEALYSLSDEFRKPFSLYHFEGLQYEEIASMLGLPVGTIKSRIFRARKALRDQINKFSSRKITDLH